MEEKLSQLKAILAEVADLSFAAAVLEWDQQTYMPSGGTEARSYQMATLSRLAHDKFVTEQVGKLLEELKKETAGLDPDSDDARLVKVANHDFHIEARVPSDYVAKFAQATARAHEAWANARHESKFSIFRPHLENLVEMGKEYVSFFPPADHPYDVLLDKYEPGMKTSEVKAIFEAMRPKQVELIQAIASRPQVEDGFLHLPYDEQKQWDFGVQVISDFGYDWRRGRQDKSAHPFTISFSVNDVRITTRFEDDLPIAALFSTMHENGHALYEQGVKQAFDRTPLVGGASLALHESQSRMWENLVGRSLPFWERYYPKYQQLFSSQLGNVSLPDFYKAVNKVEPSLIRVNADEATYNLHIMLRLELEMGMVEGKLAVKDLPEIWNAKMQEYLGITPPDDARGVLQDVHWSGGLMGYFSTYALGNLVSAQLWEKINEDIPDLPDQIRQGRFEVLLAWLRGKVHVHGRKFEPQELVQRITGSKITPEPYLGYLKAKFSQIYQL